MEPSRPKRPGRIPQNRRIQAAEKPLFTQPKPQVSIHLPVDDDTVSTGSQQSARVVPPPLPAFPPPQKLLEQTTSPRNKNCSSPTTPTKNKSSVVTKVQTPEFDPDDPRADSLPTPKANALAQLFSSDANKSKLIHLQSTTRMLLAQKMRISLLKHSARRTKIMQELLTSERTYVSGLETAQQFFLQPLQWNAKTSTNKFLTEADIAVVFGNIESILTFNRELLVALDQRIGNEWGVFQCAGDILLKRAPFLRMYSVYCEKYERAQKHLNDCLDRYPLFRQWMQQVESLNKLDLASLLIMPVQRIPRYCLLLDDALRHTPPSHPDHANLAKACSMVQEIAGSVNMYLKQSDKSKRMVHLGLKLKGLREDLVQPHRQLVMEDSLRLNKKSAPRNYVMLFTDILVVVDEPFPEIGSSLNVRAKIPLNCSRVKDLPDNYLGPAFQVVGPNKSHNILFDSAEQKLKWLSSVERATREERQQMMRRNSSMAKSIPHDQIARMQLVAKNPFTTTSLRRCSVRVDGSEVIRDVPKPFTLYFVACTLDSGLEFHIHKRYSDFVALIEALKRKYNNLPKLPPRYITQNKNLSDQVRGERQVLLDQFLQDLILHDALQHATPLFSFLTLSPLHLAHTNNQTNFDDTNTSPRTNDPTNTTSNGNNGSNTANSQHSSSSTASQNQPSSPRNEIPSTPRNVVALRIDLFDHRSITLTVSRDMFISDLRKRVCDETGITNPWRYRLSILDEHFKPGATNTCGRLLEDRDVVGLLDHFGRHHVFLECYALRISPPNIAQQDELTLEFRALKSKFSSGMFVVSQNDVVPLVSACALAAHSDVCAKEIKSARRGPLVDHPLLSDEFVGAVKESVPAWAVGKLNDHEHFAEDCFRYLISGGVNKGQRASVVGEDTTQTALDDGTESNTPAPHMLDFIMVLRKYPYHNCQLFEGLSVQHISFELSVSAGKELTVGQRVVVGVTWTRIVLLEPQTLKLLLTIPMDDLVSKRCTLDSVTLMWGEPLESNPSLQPSASNTTPSSTDGPQEHSLKFSSPLGHLLVACIAWFQHNTANEASL